MPAPTIMQLIRPDSWGEFGSFIRKTKLQRKTALLVDSGLGSNHLRSTRKPRYRRYDLYLNGQGQ